VEVEDQGILLDIDNQDDYDRLKLTLTEQHLPRIDE
jgi:CTP:molybdopterin cytidylyltransferase MocA